MADISKEDLKKEIQEILKDADLDNTSAKKVLFSLPYNCSTFAVLRHFVKYCTRQFNRKTIRAVVASVRESSLTASTVLSLPSCLESRL